MHTLADKMLEGVSGTEELFGEWNFYKTGYRIKRAAAQWEWVHPEIPLARMIIEGEFLQRGNYPQPRNRRLARWCPLHHEGYPHTTASSGASLEHQIRARTDRPGSRGADDLRRFVHAVPPPPNPRCTVFAVILGNRSGCLMKSPVGADRALWAGGRGCGLGRVRGRCCRPWPPVRGCGLGLLPWLLVRRGVRLRRYWRGLRRRCGPRVWRGTRLRRRCA